MISVYGSSTIDGSYGLSVWAAVLPSFVEFWEAVETSVGSGTYGSFVLVGPAVPAVPDDWTTYRNVAPNDKLRRQIEARHVRDGATSSGFTAAVTVSPWGAPAKLPLSPPTRTIPYADDLNYAATSDSSGQVFLNGAGTASTQKVNIGTTGTPASMQRIYRIPFTAFFPSDSTVGYDKTNYDLRPRVITSIITCTAPLTLPQGSTIVLMAIRAWKNAIGDTMSVTLKRAIDSTSFGVGTVALSALGTWTTVTSSSFSEAVNSSYMYLLESTQQSNVAAGDSRLGYVEITVTVPDLNTGL